MLAVSLLCLLAYNNQKQLGEVLDLAYRSACLPVCLSVYLGNFLLKSLESPWIEKLWG